MEERNNTLASAQNSKVELTNVPGMQRWQRKKHKAQRIIVRPACHRKGVLAVLRAGRCSPRLSRAFW